MRSARSPGRKDKTQTTPPNRKGNQAERAYTRQNGTGTLHRRSCTETAAHATNYRARTARAAPTDLPLPIPRTASATSSPLTSTYRRA
jgi:hypothetical protein